MTIACIECGNEWVSEILPCPECNSKRIALLEFRIAIDEGHKREKYRYV
jgi:predicted Zn-ribbon and HTH transcriptional regulator